ncbi:MAG: DUF4214 domain-containing protein, partial [Hyphomicrobium sp.]|nr:DUF4214 domain-containing protein [Hyphomicrobium sp.]
MPTTAIARLRSTTGDGIYERIETVTVDGTGVSIATASNYTTGHTLIDKTTTVTSADGFWVSTFYDLNGDNLTDLKTVAITTANPGQNTVKSQINFAQNGAVLSRVLTTTSANGLSKTTQTDTDGNAVYEVTATDVTVIGAGQSKTETITERNTDNSLRSQTTIAINASRTLTSIEQDSNGDSFIDHRQTIATQTNGTIVDTLSNWNPNGTKLNQTVTTTDATGLSTTTQSDYNADGLYDLTRTDVIVLNANGSRTETIVDKNYDNSIRGQTEVTTSGNELSVTTRTDLDGIGGFETTQTDVTVVNADGSRTETVSVLNANATLRNKVETTTSANGLTTTRKTDFNGDGTYDRTTNDVTVMNANGSTVQTVTEQNGNGGSLRASTVKTISADLQTASITRDTNGDGHIDQSDVVSTASNGLVTRTITNFNANGSVKNSEWTTTSANGLVRNDYVDIDGNGIADQRTAHVRTLNADGSTVDVSTWYDGSTVTKSESVTTNASGRTVTTVTDDNGDGTTDMTTADVTVFNANGSRVETITKTVAGNVLWDQSVTTTSSDGRTILFEADVYGTGVVDFVKNDTMAADGSHNILVTYPNSSFSDETDQRTISANGLASSTHIQWGLLEFINVVSTSTLNNNGSRTESYVNNDIWGYDVNSTTSANGLVKSSTLTGAVNVSDPLLTRFTTDATVLNVDGSRTQTITNTITQSTSNSAGSTDKTIATRSDDGLSKTVQLDIDGNGTFERATMNVVALDGSRTETITARNYATGALLQSDVLTTSFDGRTQSLQRDSNGDTIADHFETTVTNADGSVTGTIQNTTASGLVVETVTTTTSDDGLTKTSAIDVNGDGIADFRQIDRTVLSLDGSRINTVTNSYGDGFVRNSTTTTTSADGLTITRQFDLTGDGVADETLTDVTVLNGDGSRTQNIITRYADATLKDSAARSISIGTYNSAELTNFDTNGDEIVDRTHEEIVDQDGFRSNFSTYLNADGTQRAKHDSQVSPDGLSNYIYSGGILNPQTEPDEQFYFIPNANGSYLWQKDTATDYRSATHTIDESGVDNWVWMDQSIASYNSGGAILHTTRIDLAAENKAIETARRVYDTLLDRTMAQSEVQLLAKYIAGGVLDTNALATAVIASTEFSTKYGALTNAQFVERIFQNAVGRAASLDELKTYLVAIGTGAATRAGIAFELSERTEHVIIDNIHAVTNNTDSASPIALDHTVDRVVARDIVQRLYLSALGRAATAAELATQSQRILTGTATEAQLAIGVLALPEFATKYGTLTNTAFVTQIYANALGRAPTAAESQYWSTALTATLSRAEFMAAVAQSPDNAAAKSYLLGSDGGDILAARAFNTTIDGSAGIDTVDYSAVAGGISLSLVTGLVTKPGARQDVLIGIENAIGTNAADILTGSNTGNLLDAGTGDDTYNFYRGHARVDGAVSNADVIVDEAGNDKLAFLDAGILRSQVSFSLVGNDLLITIDDPNSATATD